MKLSEVTPVLNISKSLSLSKDVQEHFQFASRCWQLLHSKETVKNELHEVFLGWNARDWSWLKAFQLDYLTYQCNHKDLFTQYEQLQEEFPKMRRDLQCAFSYFHSGHLQLASKLVLDVLETLPMNTLPTTAAAENLNYSSSARPHMYLVPYSDGEAVHYLLCLLILCFKEVSLNTLKSDDHSLGHLLVLSQYSWPRFEPLFTEIVDRIKRVGSFTYNIFFNYIINVDILEEFANLKSQADPPVNLDIMSVSTTTITLTRTVTRGVNKGVKEDFIQTMEKQMSRSHESVTSVLQTFVTEQKTTLVQCFQK